MYLSIYPSIYLSIYLSIYQFFYHCLSAHLLPNNSYCYRIYKFGPVSSVEVDCCTFAFSVSASALILVCELGFLSFNLLIVFNMLYKSSAWYCAGLVGLPWPFLTLLLVQVVMGIFVILLILHFFVCRNCMRSGYRSFRGSILTIQKRVGQVTRYNGVDIT